MNNKPQRNEEIERIYRVFQDYIRDSPHIEWLWSEKRGYILLHMYPDEPRTVDCELILDADKLCDILFYEIALDVLGMTKNEHSPEEADPLERAEIRRRWEPYINQLPEYRHICEKLLDNGKLA